MCSSVLWGLAPGTSRAGGGGGGSGGGAPAGCAPLLACRDRPLAASQCTAYAVTPPPCGLPGWPGLPG